MNCWIHRLRRALTSSPSSLPPSLARHLRTCPDCRAEWEQEQMLTRRLAQTAPAARSESPAFLHGRILAAVRREAVPSRSTSEMPWFRRGAVAVGFVTVAIAVGILLRPQPQAPSPSSLAAFENRLPDPAELARWSKLLDQPLREEGLLVLQDARNAMAGLASQLPADLPLTALAGRR